MTGLTLTIFGTGFGNFFGEYIGQKAGGYVAVSETTKKAFSGLHIPGLSDIPVIGPLLFEYNWLVYFAIIAAVVMAWFFNRSRVGLNLRAVGEDPATADAAGINTTLYKYLATVIGGGICGIGGMYMSMVTTSGVWVHDCVSGYGWLAVALVIFATWSPAKRNGRSADLRRADHYAHVCQYSGSAGADLRYVPVYRYNSRARDHKHETEQGTRSAKELRTQLLPGRRDRKSGFVCEDGRRKNVRKPRSILRRIRGGRGYGSGSGSVIWERRKRNGIWLKTIAKRTIRLRSGIRFAINATSHSFKSFRQITPSHRRHIPARRERHPK